jgi:hypothetical protein
VPESPSQTLTRRKLPQSAGAIAAAPMIVPSSVLDQRAGAAFALGKTGGVTAMKSLEAGLARPKVWVRDAVAAASLVCPEGLLAAGSRTEALEETSLTRPR